MSAADSTKLQVNFKTPRGTLINLYADNPEQLDAELDAIAARIGTIRDIEESFGGQPAAPAAATPPVPGAVQTGSWPAASAPQAPNPGGDAPVCAHGTKVFKTGQGKRGPWSAWMCPAPKGTPGQCDPQWLN